VDLWWFWLLILVLAVFAGFGILVGLGFFAGEATDSREGWVYFVSAVDPPDAPIKIGRSSHDPLKQRLPDLQTMSPYPLTLIHTFKCEDAMNAELRIHEHLKQYRLHGEWFERDATLMFIDYLRGAA